MSRHPRAADQGFTLVELLVVMVVLGVLAAIAIPALGGQRARAHEAAVASDLRSLRVAQESVVAGASVPSTSLAALRAEGYRSSDGVVASLKADGTTWWACSTHAAIDHWLVYASDTGDVVESSTDACA